MSARQRTLLPGSDVIKPLRQGELDCLCGLYSAINAVRLTLYPRPLMPSEEAKLFTTGLTTGDLSASVPGPFGPMPAEQLIGRFVATDLLVHTWDLARAVGGDETLPTDVVENAYSGLKPMEAMMRRPGVFGPAVPAPEGADLQTEFLCFLGRPV